MVRQAIDAGAIHRQPAGGKDAIFRATALAPVTYRSASIATSPSGCAATIFVGRLASVNP